MTDHYLPSVEPTLRMVLEDQGYQLEATGGGCTAWVCRYADWANGDPHDRIRILTRPDGPVAPVDWEEPASMTDSVLDPASDWASEWTHRLDWEARGRTDTLVRRLPITGASAPR